MNIESKLPRYTSYPQNLFITSNEKLANKCIITALHVDDAIDYKKRLLDQKTLSFFGAKDILEFDNFIKEKKASLVYELNQCTDSDREQILNIFERLENLDYKSCVKMADKELSQDELIKLWQKGGQLAYGIYYEYKVKDMFDSLDKILQKELRKKEILKMKENYASMSENAQDEISRQLLKMIAENISKDVPLNITDLNKIDERVYAYNTLEKMRIAKKEENFEKEKVAETERAKKLQIEEEQKRVKKEELKDKLNGLKKEYNDVCEMNL